VDIDDVQVTVFGNDLAGLSADLEASFAKAQSTDQLVDGGLVRTSEWG
jgi:hypothetical protein